VRQGRSYSRGDDHQRAGSFGGRREYEGGGGVPAAYFSGQAASALQRAERGGVAAWRDRGPKGERQGREDIQADGPRSPKPTRRTCPFPATKGGRLPTARGGRSCNQFMSVRARHQAWRLTPGPRRRTPSKGAPFGCPALRPPGYVCGLFWRNVPREGRARGENDSRKLANGGTVAAWPFRCCCGPSNFFGITVALPSIGASFGAGRPVSWSGTVNAHMALGFAAQLTAAGGTFADIIGPARG